MILMMIDCRASFSVGWDDLKDKSIRSCRFLVDWIHPLILGVTRNSREMVDEELGEEGVDDDGIGGEGSLRWAIESSDEKRRGWGWWFGSLAACLSWIPWIRILSYAHERAILRILQARLDQTRVTQAAGIDECWEVDPLGTTEPCHHHQHHHHHHHHIHSIHSIHSIRCIGDGMGRTTWSVEFY